VGRQLVTQELVRVGRDDLVDDACLLVSELIGNAVLHARTPMTLRLTPSAVGMRIELQDGSSALPRLALPGISLMSGRGLHILERLSERWGVERLVEGGKTVWAEMEQPAAAAAELDPDDVLALWTDPEVPDRGSGSLSVEVSIDVDAMLASQAHTDDLTRDLQLLITRHEADPEFAAADDILVLARAVRHAVTAFGEPRAQIRSQAHVAARRGSHHVELHLQLSPEDGAAAREFLTALEDADAFVASGRLLLPAFPLGMTAFRREYLEAIMHQLEHRAP
jgi:hypothetical protein